MSKLHFGVCNFCDSICGLVIEHEDGKILSIRGDKEDGFSRGHICPKGLAHQDLYHDPDRIRQPLRRQGREWKQVSWPEALAEAGARLADVQKRHGNDAVAIYYGNPTSHRYDSLLMLLPFLKGFKTRNVYSATSVDALTRMLVSLWVYGNQAAVPVPDLTRTDYFLILGANPVVSNGSAMTAPDCLRRLAELRERGGKIVVLDPRRTETAAVADAHYFIRPGTDAFFLLAFLHVLFKEGLVRPGRLANMIEGLDRLKSLVQPFPPERVAEITGLSAATIRELAREFAAQERAVCYGRMGTCTQEFGSLATWLIDIVNIVTGNLDRPGGSMFCTPAVDLVGLAKFLRQPGFFNRWQSRVSGLPEFNGELPVAALAEEIETPGRGQIKALITNAGNPILSLPNGRRLDRAFSQLEFMVSIDFYLNETTRHAHLILPPTTALEMDHYAILEHALGIRNTAHYASALFPRPAGAMHNWEIMVELLWHTEKNKGVGSAILGWLKRAGLYLLSPQRQLELLLRLGPHKLSLKELKKYPHGLDLGPLEPRLEKIINTPSGKLSLVPEALAADLPRLEKRLEQWSPHTETFLLISRRTLRSINSWMHNSPRLVKAKNRCALLIHPQDAKRLGLAPGELARVCSRVGEIRVPVEISEDMMPGVVSMNHGWGHDREGVQLSVAKTNPGVSMNDLTDEEFYDRVCGISVLNGLPVTIQPA